MNMPAVLLVGSILAFGSPTVLWAGEKTADIEKTAWRNIFSDVVGHYPM